MMKKIIALVLCIGMLAAAAAGCGTPSATPYPSDAETEVKAYKDNFEDLCKYLSANGWINFQDENKDKSFNEMNYKLIGASNGYRFNCTKQNVNGVMIELYDFSKPASPDEVYNKVKKDGKFSVYDLEEVNAYLSDNGKYMAVYADTSINWKNPDKNADNYKHFEEFMKLFKGFHK
jgi:hypothetical protein